MSGTGIVLVALAPWLLPSALPGQGIDSPLSPGSPLAMAGRGWHRGDHVAVSRADILLVRVLRTNWGWMDTDYPLERLRYSDEKLRIVLPYAEIEVEHWSASPDSLHATIAGIVSESSAPSGIRRAKGISAAAGGTPEAPAPRATHPFQPSSKFASVSFSISAGGHAGNQAEDFFGAAEALGLPDPCDQPGVLCIGGSSADESILMEFALACAWNDTWEARAIFSGGADGPGYGFWFEEDSAMRFGLLLSMRLEYLRVGLGPALHVTRITALDETHRHRRIGWVVESGLTWPRRTRLFLDLSFQYWYGGRVPLGAEPPLSDNEFSLNRNWLGLGLGFREILSGNESNR